MEVIEGIDHYMEDGLVLTVGFFDGVHAGHRFLIKQVKEVADEEHLKSALFTFWPHPRIVLHERYKPRLLNSIEEKINLLKMEPIDYCIRTAFTMELANLQAFDFMKMLRDKLNVKHLVIGYDHRFGRNREEGFDDYCKYGQQLGIKVTQADPYVENNYTISSSFIRQLIAVGEINMANHYLGYPYSISGTVVKGKQVGRTIGYPTANLKLTFVNKCLPKIGVYAVMAEVDNKRYKAMLYIGTRPTTPCSPEQPESSAIDSLSIEVYLFDFNNDLYDKEMTIYVVEHVRNQHKFESMEALKQQIDKDKKMVLNMLRCY